VDEKEGWIRSHTLSVLRSKFESEERYIEVIVVAVGVYVSLFV
jgi:hypothetical protein